MYEQANKSQDNLNYTKVYSLLAKLFDKFSFGQSASKIQRIKI